MLEDLNENFHSILLLLEFKYIERNKIYKQALRNVHFIRVNSSMELRDCTNVVKIFHDHNFSLPSPVGRGIVYNR